MSSLASAPEGAAPGNARAAQPARALRLRAGADAVVGLALCAGLVLLTFVTAGGVDLGPNTWAEIVLVLLAAVVAIALLVFAPAGRPWGLVSLALFAAAGILSAVSIAWSVQPDNSWVEANRTLAYVAVFGGGVALARLMGARWRGVIGGLALAATLLSAYALLVKVFPGTFDRSELMGRVRAPFDYWNATGLMAAMGLPACLWCGARRDRGRPLGALAVPAVALLWTVLILSYSRSALVAAIVGLIFWFATVPLRLRAALVLLLGSAGGAVLTIWALATHPLTHDRVSLASRTSAGHSFGLLLVLVLVVLTGAGLAAAFAMDRASPTPELRRRLGIVLIALVALLPLAGVGAMAASSRGLTGEVSHVWHTLTNPDSRVGDSPSRLVEFGNSRPRYWSEGLKVGEHHLLDGAGAGAYGVARTRYTTDPWIVEHAHSYVIETFADFGLIGIAVNLALLIAWGLAVSRTFLNRRVFQPAMDVVRQADADEKGGMLTLLAIVIVFGVNSAVDWTWFVPGVAVPALFCAGWLAGRGPLGRPAAELQPWARLRERPAVLAGATAIVAVAVFAAWMVWQPLRSAQADSAAVASLSSGDAGAAFAQASAAHAHDPLAVEPLWELSAIYSATGDQAAARARLNEAISLQPANPATWQQLGFYDLQRHQPRQAIAALAQARRLDLTSAPTIQAIQQAQAEMAGSQARP